MIFLRNPANKKIIHSRLAIILSLRDRCIFCEIQMPFGFDLTTAAVIVAVWLNIYDLMSTVTSDAMFLLLLYFKLIKLLPACERKR